MKRTHLPLNGLRVLDAAARHLSFTRAADELAVTPAAVGQQIRALEDTLGVVLFRRTTKGLELTPEGEAGLAALRAGFLQFEESVRAMQAGQSSKSLTIAAPRDLTAKWLMPRLAEIARGDRRAALRAGRRRTRRSISPRPISISRSAGARARASMRARRSESDGMVTVERPGGGADTRDRLARLPRRGRARRWSASADAGLALDAAAAGLGRATRARTARARRSRRRAASSVVGEPTPSRLGYWLVAPLPQWRQKKVKALVDALAGREPAAAA